MNCSKIYSVVLVVLVVVLSSAANAQQKQAGFKITISMAKTTVPANSAVKLTVELTNITSHQIHVSVEKSEEVGELTYAVDVRDSNGAEANESKYHRALRGASGDDSEVIVTAPGLIPLEAGGVRKDKINLKKLYDLSKPGTYTVHVSRIDDESGVTVESNVLRFTVD